MFEEDREVEFREKLDDYMRRLETLIDGVERLVGDINACVDEVLDSVEAGEIEEGRRTSVRCYEMSRWLTEKFRLLSGLAGKMRRFIMERGV